MFHLTYRQRSRRLQPGGKRYIDATLCVLDCQHGDYQEIPADPVNPTRFSILGDWRAAVRNALAYTKTDLDNAKFINEVLGDPVSAHRAAERRAHWTRLLERVLASEAVEYEESQETYVVEHFVSEAEAAA